jgi:hypothetical protein
VAARGAAPTPRVEGFERAAASLVRRLAKAVKSQRFQTEFSAQGATWRFNWRASIAAQSWIAAGIGSLQLARALCQAPKCNSTAERISAN